jgi:tRNA U55 pseudouridine synthase TruB
MKTFYLRTKKSKEVLIKTSCYSIEEAIEYFAEKKKLSRTDLIRIFDVDIYTPLPSGGTSRREKR